MSDSSPVYSNQELLDRANKIIGRVTLDCELLTELLNGKEIELAHLRDLLNEKEIEILNQRNEANRATKEFEKELRRVKRAKPKRRMR